jgi:antitoxin component YwqK of YwqJK toxin-antitoxin module
MKRNCTFIRRVEGTIYLLIFFICFLAVGCHHTEQEKYPSGKIMIEKSMKGKKLDGGLKMWYESGSVKQKAIYKSDKLYGLLECWYVSGTKESEEMYVNGLKNGKSRSWDEEGNLLEEKNYVNDTLNGEYKNWYTTGIMKIEGTYRVGLYHGKWQYFNQIGVKVGEGNFVDGNGILVGYDDNGKKNHEVNYVKNKRQGKEIEFNSDGSIRETKEYSQDKIVKVIKGG